MKNLFTIILTALLVMGCGSDKKVDPTLAGTITDPPTTAPADMSLTVINNTGHDLVGAQTWCMTGACETPIPSGDTVKLESNMTDANTITIKMYPPKDLVDANPTTGLFQMNYQWWKDNTCPSGCAHVTCDNECNHGNPTATHPSSPSDNWIYECKWAQDPSPKKGGINNTVILTVKAK